MAQDKRGDSLAERLKQIKLEGVAGSIDLSDPCCGRIGKWVPQRVSKGRPVALE